MTKGQRIFQARETRGLAERPCLPEPTVVFSGFLRTYFPAFSPAGLGVRNISLPKIHFSIPIQTLVLGELLHILQNMSAIFSVKTSCVSEVEPP